MGVPMWVKWGENVGIIYWILIPTKGFLHRSLEPKMKEWFFRFRFQTSVPNFVKIGQKLRPWECGHTSTQRWQWWMVILISIAIWDR